MKKTLRRQKSAYVLSSILCFVGLAGLLVAVWKTWPQVSSSENPFSTFGTLLWTERIDFVQGFGFRLIYATVLASTSLIVGIVVLVLSRQWFYLPGKTLMFECPFCKNRWTALGDKGLVHCPHCQQLIHPKMIDEHG